MYFLFEHLPLDGLYIEIVLSGVLVAITTFLFLSCILVLEVWANITNKLFIGQPT